jgi:hypothetical protein
MQILSARMWQIRHGKVNLIADAESLVYFKRIGVTDIYDEVEELDISLLEGIDPKIYFAAGKLSAQLQASGNNLTFIDTDLLISSEIDRFNPDVVTVFHREFPENSVYPNLWKHWQTEIPLDLKVQPINCALVSWPDEELRRNYASLALKFMRANTYHGRFTTNSLMVTAEQRLLAMYLKWKGVQPDYYIKDIYLPDTQPGIVSWQYSDEGTNIEAISDEFIHLWGHKSILRNDPLQAAEYTMKLFDICQRYPELKVDNILNKMIK